jgi:hypothetical protein
MKRRHGELEYGHEMPFIVGEIGAIHLPYNLPEHEADEYAAELRAKELRRRPVGFAPWPDEPNPLSPGGLTS